MSKTEQFDHGSSPWALVRDISHLKKLASDAGYEEFLIPLNGGVFTAKEILHKDGCWHVYHSISDTSSEYMGADDFMEGESFIMEAMKMGKLFYDR